MTQPSIADFLTAGVPAAVSGSDAWGRRYAHELRQIVTEAARHAPRSVQVHLGPSELGVECDRQVAGKLAQVPPTNHVADPWPSIVGTAVHAWLADAFDADNDAHRLRWLTEKRVVPLDDHSGTADLYDADEQTVVDHKCLGDSTMAKLKIKGPPRHYEAQLYLYGLGYQRLGLPVKRVAIAAWPRTRSTLDSLYVWSTPFGEHAAQLLEDVIADTERRKGYAAEMITEGRPFLSIPATPTDDGCYFCPFYRPQPPYDGTGCPGTKQI